MIVFWYASRAGGLVSLVLLTGTVLLGITGVARSARSRWPRFVVAMLHRNLALLTLGFLVLHIATAVLDPFPGIGWLDTVVPFGSRYHPFWLGLGAVALDLLIALVVTSMLRPHISYRMWRAVHWAAYACWPVAVTHALGIPGGDAHLSWVLVLTLGCIAAVVAALGWRLLGTPSTNRPVGDPLAGARATGARATDARVAGHRAWPGWGQR